jgi:uroporphyrinogen-III synthase
VDAVSARLAARGIPRATLQGAPVIAVGSQAAERMVELGIAAERVLPGACARALSDNSAFWTRGPLQFFTGGEGRPALVRELSALGAVVRSVTTYSLYSTPLHPLPGRLDLVVCASSSAARAVFRLHAGLHAVPALAIGPLTEQALRDLGATRVTRAEDDTVESVMAGAVRMLAAPAAGPAGGRPPGGEAGGRLDRSGQAASDLPEAAP